MLGGHLFVFSSGKTSMSAYNAFKRIVRTTWSAWGVLCRLVINLVITFIVIGIVAFALYKPRVPDSTALVVDPQGALVEQYSGDLSERGINGLQGRQARSQTRLRDVVTAIEVAKHDGRIKALVLKTDDMAGGGLLGGAALSDLQDIGRAIQDFKGSGKPVFALGASYDQGQYYLASFADTVFIHPQGMVLVRGYGIYQPYFKDALDKLGVEVNVFRVGKYKSAVEPLTLNGMSPAARSDWSGVVNVLWNAYTQDVAKARKLGPEVLSHYIADADTKLAAVGGDTAMLALKAGLVDKIATEDEMAAAVGKVVGEENHGYRQIEYLDYLQAVDNDQQSRGGNTVGIIVAAGDIQPGDQPPGTIGGDSTSELIRLARYDDSVKAVVLRVDSPGGSAYAADLILREIELLKAAHKPVIVSMGAVAASGGYWISMAGDEILANRTTLTGSIGIFGLFPTFEKALARIGVHSDGVGTTNLSDAFDVSRPMSPLMQKLVTLDIEYGYQQFISKVAQHRHMSVEAVNQVAQGRVWSGLEAKRIGLVDKFGNLHDAIAEAARLGKLGPHYAVRYIEQPPSFEDRLLIALSNNGEASLAFHPSALLPDTTLTTAPWFSEVRRLAEALKAFTDPRGIYAYCFCNPQ